jgi:hypothetical protein
MRASTLRFRLFALVVLITVAGPGPTPRGSVRCSGRGTGLGCSSAGRMGGARPGEWVIQPRAAKRTPTTSSGVARLMGTARRSEWSEVTGAARTLRQNRELAAELREPSAELEASARRLARWQRFRQSLHSKWEQPPDRATIDGALEQAEAAGGEDARKHLADYLSCRARLEGHAELARSLRGGADPPDAEAVLRDLKKLSGSTKTEPAPATHPPGPPVPEGPAAGFRQGVRGSLGVDLPRLQELSAAERKARDEVSREVERLATRDWHRAQIQLARLAPYVRQATAQPDAPDPVQSPSGDDPALAGVGTLAGRELSAADRMLAKHLLAQKQSPKEVAAILKQLGPEKGGEK